MLSRWFSQISWLRADGMGERQDGEVTRLNDRACFDLADRRYCEPGLGSGLFLGKARLLSQGTQPLGESFGLLAVAAVRASSASWASHPAIVG